MKPRVLAVRLDNDGDVLLTGPAVRALASAASSVTLWCGPRGAAAARLLPGVDGVLVHRAEWIDPEPEPLDRQAVTALVDELAEGSFDQAFIFTSFHQSPLPAALLLKMAGIGFVAAISDDYPGSLLDLRHRTPDDQHEVTRSLGLVEAAGYRLPPADDGRLAVLVPETNSLELPAPYVVVHPGASVPARAWEPEKNRTLVKELAQRGDNVVVTGGPSETALTAYVAGPEHPRVTNLGGATDLIVLAEILAGAEVVVVGNTGPTHLAAAVGTPVVCLFAPTVPAVRWRPWGVDHVLLGDQEIGCAGCRARMCPVEGHPCLSTVSVESVLDAMDSIRLVNTQGGPALAEAAR
ncbi:MAG TPA: glycosyltransferase family 9 protein [Actinomycetota bacterium]|nr:glycosyltransferase family 9 protein [Actinomycetota bacterium]